MSCRAVEYESVGTREASLRPNRRRPTPPREGDGVYEVTLAAPAAAGAYDVMVAAADADATTPPLALASAGVVYVT